MAMTIGGKTPQSIKIDGKAVQSLAISGEVVWSASPVVPFYLENQYNGLTTITLAKRGTPSGASSLEWSGDLVTWTQVTYNSSGNFLIGLPNLNQRVYFRSTTCFSSSTSDRYTFSADHNFSAGGNIRWLIDYSHQVSAVPAYNFYSMFENATTLTDVSKISFSDITSVGDYGMSGMFSGCTQITNGADLRTITSVSHTAGMSSLYQGCSALVTAVAPNTNPWKLPDETYSMATYGWLASVSATGTLYCPTGVSITSNHTSGRPSGWTRVDY